MVYIACVFRKSRAIFFPKRIWWQIREVIIISVLSSGLERISDHSSLFNLCSKNICLQFNSLDSNDQISKCLFCKLAKARQKEAQPFTDILFTVIENAIRWIWARELFSNRSVTFINKKLRIILFKKNEKCIEVAFLNVLYHCLLPHDTLRRWWILCNRISIFNVVGIKHTAVLTQYFKKKCNWALLELAGSGVLLLTLTSLSISQNGFFF